MKTKIISIALAVAVMLSAVALLSGCSDGEYPVEVANLKIESKPENIVVLDAPTADILIATGYDRYIVGRSDEVDQKSVEVAPSMGSSEKPDADKIIETGADLVFAGPTIDESVKNKLSDKGIQVIKMSHGDTPKQVETNYITISKICGGTKTGAKNGEDTYNDLLDKMNNYKQQVNSRNSGILDTVCYLYTEDDQLRIMSNGTYGDMLLGYTGAVNVAVNITDNAVDVATLRVANPNFIFYADDATLKKIKSDATLAGLGAVKNGKILEVPIEEMSRPGNTSLEALEKWFTLCIRISSRNRQQPKQPNLQRIHLHRKLPQQQPQPQLRRQRLQTAQSRLRINTSLPLHLTFHLSRRMKTIRLKLCSFAFITSATSPTRTM